MYVSRKDKEDALMGNHEPTSSSSSSAAAPSPSMVAKQYASEPAQSSERVTTGYPIDWNDEFQVRVSPCCWENFPHFLP